MTDEVEGPPERSHYHFSISLRMWHPTLDPAEITEAMGIQPRHSGKAGERRLTPKGVILNGLNRSTFWIGPSFRGRWPSRIGDGIHEVLSILVAHRAFLHSFRSEGGRIELFTGWFFENQSGDVLSHQCMALAGDLQVDLSFDVYPPDQPQNEGRS